MLGLLAACAALLACAAGANAAGAVHLDHVDSFGEGTSLVSSPADPNRLFITLRGGEIWSLDEGEDQLVVDLTPLIAPIGEEEVGGVPQKNGEEALNSMVLAPDFATTGRFYVDYPSAEHLENIVVAELIDKGSPAEVLASRKTVLEIPHGDTHHHFSGDLHFGPEGDLFISVGDGFPNGAEGGNYPDESTAQDLSTMLGKILRIRPTPGAAQPYAVPSDNPFVLTAGAKPEIWSFGLRNPFRFSIDAPTGDILIGNVGQEKWEDIELGVGGGAAGPVGGAGANYGWPCKEGGENYTPKPEPACPTLTPNPPFTEPMLKYAHSEVPPLACSVINGFVEHDPTVAALDGRLVYGDFCSGQLSSVKPEAGTPAGRSETELTASLQTQEEAAGRGNGEFARAFKLQSFGEDACGRVYVLTQAVYRIAGETPADCGLLHIDVKGSGSVAGAGLACPGSCDKAFTSADTFTATDLTPTPASGWHFVGWEGACGGSGSCAPQMNANRQVTAVFEQDQSSSSGGNSGSGGSDQGQKPPANNPPAPSVGKVTVGAFKADKKNGTGTLTVIPAGAGKVKLTGKGIVAVTRSVSGKKLSLPVKPTGKTKKTLKKKGRYAVKLTVAFTPKGGKVGKATKKVTLLLR